MKVAIDTRYDTLEEALAVVALAFETSAKGATRKPKRAAKKATSGRKPGRKRAAPAEPKAADTATDAASPSETTGSRRRTGTKKERCPKGNSREDRHDECATQEVDDPQGGGDSAGHLRDRCRTGHCNEGGSIEGSGDKDSLEERERQRERVKPKRVAAKKANPAQAQPPKPANVAPPGQSDKIRAWARSQGMQVADAGRMSAAVIAAYKAHHN